MSELELEINFDDDIFEEEEEWPKIVKTYVHGSKEYGYELGEELGLEGDALKDFSYLHYEVELTIKVEEDGSYVTTHVDGYPVLPVKE